MVDATRLRSDSRHNIVHRDPAHSYENELGIQVHCVGVGGQREAAMVP